MHMQRAPRDMPGTVSTQDNSYIGEIDQHELVANNARYYSRKILSSHKGKKGECI